MANNEITPGLCQCGCGQLTRISSGGSTRGQPCRFVYGHNRRGVRHTQESRDAMSKSHTGLVQSESHKAASRVSRFTSEKAIASWQTLAAASSANRGKTLPESHRAAIARGKLGVLGTPHQREMKRGENNPLWKGGVPDSGCGSLGKNWAEAVKTRDNYTCQKCGRHGEDRSTHAHHIVPFDDDPSLRFVISNGLTLCARCHKRHHMARARQSNAENQLRLNLVAHQD